VLRITQKNGSTSTTLKIEGRVNGGSVAELAKACLPLLGLPARLVLDLAGVKFIDDAGVEVVRALLRRNVRVRGCSPLVANLLKETQE
jgi:anti-anti-sigma regulatory factor